MLSCCFRQINYKKPVISDSQNNPKEEESGTDQPIHYQNILFNGNSFISFKKKNSVNLI